MPVLFYVYISCLHDFNFTLTLLLLNYFSYNSSLQLGEEKFSYGYGGTAKISENCKFKNYGRQFGAGDIIGCYLVSL